MTRNSRRRRRHIGFWGQKRVHGGLVLGLEVKSSQGRTLSHPKWTSGAVALNPLTASSDPIGRTWVLHVWWRQRTCVTTTYRSPRWRRPTHKTACNLHALLPGLLLASFLDAAMLLETCKYFTLETRLQTVVTKLKILYWRQSFRVIIYNVILPRLSACMLS